jgi:uncharacterized peroxidase-related enzyme
MSVEVRGYFPRVRSTPAEKPLEISMPRIDIPTRDEAHPDTRPILDGVNKLLGFVPNLHRLMSLNPNVLTGWAGLQGALSKTLDVKTRDAIAMAVSDANDCDYCLAAHGYIANVLAKISPDEIALNRQGGSANPKIAAAATFAKQLIETRGKVSDEQLAAVRDAGYSDGDVVAIIGLAAQFLMTNFMNNVADTAVDFPEIASVVAA